MTATCFHGAARSALLASALASSFGGWCGAPASAQGVPTFDMRLFAGRQAIVEQREQDLALQQDRLARVQELAEIERQQLAALNAIMDAMTLRAGDVAGSVAGLESGQGEAAGISTAAASLYAPEDPNPASARIFGDAREGVEELIIRAARHTHGLPGVGRAGLTLVQWRCLLQALIWQESRFQIGARSPAGAFGLTQIMPDTAGDLGIYPAYYDDPWLQVTGGARYLAQMLGMFDGNIIHALAAYNAGPGRVQQYGGVPPFAETQAYVVVTPQQYNRYLAAVGGIDALGTVDPVLLANASFSLSAHGAGVYGDYSLVSVQAAALRVQDIIARIGETRDLNEAIALNTYARAELARLVAIRTRIKAVHTQPLSEEQLAMAAVQVAERQFMNFTLETLR
ncbi:soluble lytic murein transglycosylase-like protein [Rhodovulum steppense]|uniref:Soluble lytic murein transglycosylase-like protein n=2 Tax=Paracoccaceae TaxID=31989 RepID=A0A4V2R4N1_9RHOB|nr:soluble lytic murein transglycosylase-like protein [Rhodovulum steppense]